MVIREALIDSGTNLCPLNYGTQSMTYPDSAPYQVFFAKNRFIYSLLNLLMLLKLHQLNT